MPLVGTRNLGELSAKAPLVDHIETERLELPASGILQLMYEIDDDAMVSLLPPALHPTIPPTLVFTVTKVPESPVGPFVLAEVKVGGRSGARPRGLLLQAFANSQPAIEMLRKRWGYPVDLADCSLEKRYDRIHARVARGDEALLDMTLLNPEPISGNDLQYLAGLNLARMARNGTEETRLIQVDPDFTFRSADRGQPHLETFVAAAWGVGDARTIHPVSASYAVADITMPAVRYLVDPVKSPLTAVERV